MEAYCGSEYNILALVKYLLKFKIIFHQIVNLIYTLFTLSPDDCGLCKQWTAAYAKDRASINELTHVIILVIRHRKRSRIANEKLGDFLRDANHKETLSALIIDCIETNRSGSRSRSTSKTVSDKKIQKKVHDLLGSMSSDLSDEEQPAPIQSTIEASPRITARKNQEKTLHS